MPVLSQSVSNFRVVQPDGVNVSAAQLSSEEKNAISHRGNALRKLAKQIVQ